MNQSKLLTRLSYFATSNNVNQIINILNQIIFDLEAELNSLSGISLYIGRGLNTFPFINNSVGRIGIDVLTSKIYSFNGEIWNQIMRGGVELQPS
jgi:hypothetical protein